MEEDLTVGLAPDFQVSASPKVVKTGSTVLVVGIVLMVFLVLILIFILFLWFSSSPSPVVTVIDPVKELCEGKWNNGTCSCDRNRSGANCQLQEVGFYLYTGALTVPLPGISRQRETSLRNCQTLCNDTQGCTAIQWRHDSCTLLSNASVTSSETIYAPYTQAGLYVQKLEDAVFGDRAFLAARSIDIPRAYSQVISSTGFMQVFLDTITTVNFIPRHVVMPPGVTGIFSQTPFTSLPPSSDTVLYFRDTVVLPSSWSGSVTVLFTVLP